MKKFNVTFTYSKEGSVKSEVIRVNSNGVGKAIEVAEKSFTNKHKKDINEISSVTHTIKQVVEENEEI